MLFLIYVFVRSMPDDLPAMVVSSVFANGTSDPGCLYVLATKMCAQTCLIRGFAFFSVFMKSNVLEVVQTATTDVQNSLSFPGWFKKELLKLWKLWILLRPAVPHFLCGICFALFSGHKEQDALPHATCVCACAVDDL